MNGKRKDITKEDLLSVENTIKTKKAVSIITEISENVSQWKKFADDVNVFPELRDRIDKTLVIL
jgi:serine/threonine-protein kinase HipA